MQDYKKKKDESDKEYIYRMCSQKDNIGNWSDVALLINTELNSNYSASTYARAYQYITKYYDVFAKIDGNEYLENLKVAKIELEKERIKLRDERTEYKRLIREEARRESLLESFKQIIKENNTLRFKPSKIHFINSNNEMIINVCDVHQGMNVSNSFNKYNDDIIVNRLKQYSDKIYEINSLHKCKNCYVFLGGDMISGLIHDTIRMENNENVIEQLKNISIHIGDFINFLKDLFENVYVHEVDGNHSRLMQNKDKQLKEEYLDSLVPFYLNMMFKDVNNVYIYENNEIDSTIASFKTMGNFLFYGVHGHLDKMDSVLSSLTLLTGEKPDCILMGHRHYNCMSGGSDTKIVQSGCFVGADDYCMEHRLCNKPEQAVIITNQNQAVECIYNVILD